MLRFFDERGSWRPESRIALRPPGSGHDAYELLDVFPLSLVEDGYVRSKGEAADALVEYGLAVLGIADLGPAYAHRVVDAGQAEDLFKVVDRLSLLDRDGDESVLKSPDVPGRGRTFPHCSRGTVPPLVWESAINLIPH